MLENIKIKKYISQIDNKIAKYTKYSTKKILISVITIFIIIYSCLLIYRYFFSSGSGGSSNGSNEIPVVKRPFLNLYAVMKDGRDVLTNIVFITHSFTRDDCEVDYNNYKAKGIHFLGLSSYSEFPGPISNPHDVLHDPKHKAYTFNYFDLTRGWCTVFREENNKKWLKEGFPRLQIAESDFANYENHNPDPNVKKEYDFIYICLKDGEKKETDKDCPEGWQSVIRKFDIAKKLIDIMCTKYKLKGLLVGRIGCEVPPSCHQLMELTDFQEYNTFISNFNKSKFILTTSEADASPRSLTEAMCFNLPALVNKKILGGWQYINDETGEFFDPDNLDGFEPILDKFLKKLNNNEYKPREWFIKNYGKYNSGKRLKTFVQSV